MEDAADPKVVEADEARSRECTETKVRVVTRVYNEDVVVHGGQFLKFTESQGDPRAIVRYPAGTATFSVTTGRDETGVWYSLKEMRVKKGDIVRVKATNTKGMHDFTIDEFGVTSEG